MYERKRDTLPNPGHDLIQIKSPPSAEGVRGWVIVNLDSRFKYKRELVKLKNAKKWAQYFGDKIVAVRGEQRR